MTEKQLSKSDQELAKKMARKLMKNIPYQPYYDDKYVLGDSYRGRKND